MPQGICLYVAEWCLEDFLRQLPFWRHGVPEVILSWLSTSSKAVLFNYGGTLESTEDLVWSTNAWALPLVTLTWHETWALVAFESSPGDSSKLPPFKTSPGNSVSVEKHRLKHDGPFLTLCNLRRSFYHGRNHPSCSSLGALMKEELELTASLRMASIWWLSVLTLRCSVFA